MFAAVDEDLQAVVDDRLRSGRMRAGLVLAF
jgi:hypothetical protein